MRLKNKKDIDHWFLVLPLYSMFSVHREKDTQTKQDNYSNISKPQVFMEGLRGGGVSIPTVMTKVDLTVDVSEPPIVREFIVKPKKK